MSPVSAGLRLLPFLVLSSLLGALPAAAGWKLDDVIGSDTISLTLERVTLQILSRHARVRTVAAATPAPSPRS